jgi:hypothetical protein
LVFSVVDDIVGVLDLSVVDVIVGVLVLSVGEVIALVGACFWTGVLLRELGLVKSGKGDLRRSFECCRGSDLTTGEGAPSSLPLLGVRLKSSELDQTGPPLIVFGLPKGVLVSGPSRSSFVMPLRRNPFKAAKFPFEGVPFAVDGRSSVFL